VRNPLLNSVHRQRQSITQSRRKESFDLLLSLRQGDDQPHVIIVGKIIVDEYGPPNHDAAHPNLTVGGGGPQAAMGAALALATLQYQGQKQDPIDITQLTPPPQPITLMAAVGELDFGHNGEEEALQEILGGVLKDPPLLLRGKGCITPRIRLWHEGTSQTLKWYAIDNSFGDERGAGRLWKTTPTTADYINLIEKCTVPTTRSKPILHVICEAGVEAPGRNGDSIPLLDQQIRQSIAFLGVEPILFPKEDGKVSPEDAIHCSRLLQDILEGSPPTNSDTRCQCSQVSVVISPDKAAYQSMVHASCLPMTTPSSQFSLDSIAVREGPDGSTIITTVASSDALDSPLHIPAASLRSLKNPTGAGNAYSAAYTTLRGSGCDTITSSCIATGIGAVFCEYDHCPPYTYEVLDRIILASEEVRRRVIRKQNDCKNYTPNQGITS
jgi:hypothetical protein